MMKQMMPQRTAQSSTKMRPLYRCGNQKLIKINNTNIQWEYSNFNYVKIDDENNNENNIVNNY